MVTHVTDGSVFDDLGFSKEESQNLKIRSVLMQAVEQYIIKNKLTQSEAAKLLGVTQPRVSDLMRGKISLFTIDILVKMMTRINISVALVIDDRLAA